MENMEGMERSDAPPKCSAKFDKKMGALIDPRSPSKTGIFGWI